MQGDSTNVLPQQAIAARNLNLETVVGRQSGRVSRALCEAAAFAADEMNSRIIAVFTESGLMARRLSSLRPDQRIIALTSSREAINELAAFDERKAQMSLLQRLRRSISGGPRSATFASRETASIASSARTSSGQFSKLAASFMESGRNNNEIAKEAACTMS